MVKTTFSIYRTLREIFFMFDFGRTERCKVENFMQAHILSTHFNVFCFKKTCASANVGNYIVFQQRRYKFTGFQLLLFKFNSVERQECLRVIRRCPAAKATNPWPFSHADYNIFYRPTTAC